MMHAFMQILAKVESRGISVYLRSPEAGWAEVNSGLRGSTFAILLLSKGIFKDAGSEALELTTVALSSKVPLVLMHEIRASRGAALTPEGTFDFEAVVSQAPEGPVRDITRAHESVPWMASESSSLAEVSVDAVLRQVASTLGAGVVLSTTVAAKLPFNGDPLATLPSVAGPPVQALAMASGSGSSGKNFGEKYMQPWGKVRGTEVELAGDGDVEMGPGSYVQSSIADFFGTTI